MILIASCYYQNNYGSKLQAYATQTFLDRKGIENCTINFNGLKKRMTRIKINYYIKNIARVDVFITQLKKYFFKLCVCFNSQLKKNIELRENAMNQFSVNKFRVTEVYPYNKLTDLCINTNSVAVVVGSDQLWLPSNIYSDYYTLNFVPEGIKKISYATSFGVNKLDKNIAHKAKIFLDKFDSISVREEKGVEIIKKVTDREAMIVCDPTMLFDAGEWINILNLGKQKKENGRYIFCYFLGNNSWQRKWAKDLAQEKELKIKALIHLEEYIKSDIGYADEELYDVDPANFVNLIKNAEYICTDSFHGTVFALLFHKCFFSFRRFDRNYSANTNSRLDSLLKPLGLKNRIIISQNGSVPINDIDYDTVDKKIEEFRNRSSEWFINSLGELCDD